MISSRHGRPGHVVPGVPGVREARIAPLVVASALMLAVGEVAAEEVSFGQRLFQDKADCKFCHGLNGDGRGDPRAPGGATDLRKTILDRGQLIEVIACGRPATAMPHFDKFAYEDKRCDGLSAADLGKDVPPLPDARPLSSREIEAVADYILATFVAK